MELFDILSAIGIGMAIGLAIVAFYGWLLWRRIKRHVDQLVAKVVQDAESSMIGLHIELDNGIYFCYNNEDKAFVCQGATVEEIKKAFQQRYPNKTAYLAGGDPAVVEYFKSELLRLKTNENSTGQ